MGGEALKWVTGLGECVDVALVICITKLSYVTKQDIYVVFTQNG